MAIDRWNDIDPLTGLNWDDLDPPDYRRWCYGKGGGSAPQPPDPAATAAAQGAANKEAVFESARVNQIGTEGPWGKTYFTGDVGAPDRTQVTELSPGSQATFDNEQAIAQQLSGYGTQLAGQVANGPAEFNLDGLPTAPWEGDRSAQIGGIEDATYQRGYNLLSPEMDRSEEAMRTRLANQGITEGSKAYDTAYDRFDTGKSQQLNDLALASVNAGRAEDSRLFGLGSQARSQALGENLTERTQPMNELAAILQGAPALGTPQGVAPGQYGVQPGDIQGATALHYQGLLNNYNQRVGAQGATQGGLMSLGGNLGSAAIMQSDIRLKKDITRVGEMDNGLPIYTYRYKEGGPVQMGVMAHEVEKVNPAAVHEIDGFKAVDYGAL